jgi:hypothetical protein
MFVVPQVFLLMPFLRTDLSFWEQRLLATASRRHGPRLAAAAGWVQSSPGWVQDRVVQAMLPGAEPHAADSLRAALNYRGCLNNWHMAAHEFRWGHCSGGAMHNTCSSTLCSAGCSRCWSLILRRALSACFILVPVPVHAVQCQSCSRAAVLYRRAPDVV